MNKTPSKFLRQLFCRHEPEYCRDTSSRFCNLNGATVYKVCKKCGKVVDKEFMTNEELLLKFGKVF